MFGFRISPMKVVKPNSAYVGYPLSDKSNPFDSDDELDHKQSKGPSRITPEPLLTTPDIKTNPFDDDCESDHMQAKTPLRRIPEPLLATPDIKTNPFHDDCEENSRNTKNSVNSSRKMTPSRRTPEPLVTTPYFKTNPFDDDGDENSRNGKSAVNCSRKMTPESLLTTPNIKTNPFDDEDDRRDMSSNSLSSTKSKYKNDFRDSDGLENQFVQKLENYAEHKAKETTKSVKNCLQIAEEIREDATKTLVTLHQQGEQITRTHYNAVDIDHDLSRGEKLLGSLGGLFSKTWKPKKARSIKGPAITRDDLATERSGNLEDRENLGLPVASKGQLREQALQPPTSALQKVEVEKAKQDDALCDLSNLLGELKNMAVDMGSEIDRHNKALDHLYDDVDELHSRVKGANQRGRRLLGK